MITDLSGLILVGAVLAVLVLVDKVRDANRRIDLILKDHDDGKGAQ